MNLLSYLAKERFLLDRHPTFFSPLFIDVVLQKLAADVTSGESSKVLRSIGRVIGKYVYTFVTENIPTKNPSARMKKFMEQLPLFGWGEFEIISLGEDAVKVKNTNSPFASQYKHSFGEQGEAVDHFLLGIFEGAWEKHTEKQVHGSEAACISCGDPVCVFEVSTTDTVVEIGFEEEATQYILNRTTKYDHNAFIRKVVQQDLLKVEGGKLTLWGILSYGSPYPLMDVFCKTVCSIAPPFQDVIAFTCLTQTKNAIAFHKQRFGMEDLKQIQTSLLSQQEMMVSSLVTLQCQEKLLQFSYKDAFRPFETLDTSLLNQYYVFALLEAVLFYTEGKTFGNGAKNDDTQLEVPLVEAAMEYEEQLTSSVPEEIRSLITEKLSPQYFLS